MIDPDSWEESLAAGWRWVTNLEPGTVLGNLAMDELHSGSDIAIGVAFDANTMAPSVGAQGLGLYIRDYDLLVAEIYEDVLNFECGHELQKKKKSRSEEEPA